MVIAPNKTRVEKDFVRRRRICGKSKEEYGHSVEESRACDRYQFVKENKSEGLNQCMFFEGEHDECRTRS